MLHDYRARGNCVLRRLVELCHTTSPIRRPATLLLRWRRQCFLHLVTMRCGPSLDL
jgi:hypothetical protein